MRATTDKDYIDARDAALLSALREQAAREANYRAEMDARWAAILVNLYKSTAGIALASVTVSTSVTGYMLNSMVGPMQVEIRKMQADIQKIQITLASMPASAPPPAPAPPAPIIIYPRAPAPGK